MKGDIGVISDSLFDLLFPALAHAETTDSATQHIQTYHVAISPQAPSAYRQPDLVVPWTVLAVHKQSSSRSDNQSRQPQLRFPATSSALYTFTQNLQKTSTNIARLALQVPIDIHILPTAPIGLDTVVVSIDEEALAKLEAANQKFRKGSHGSSLRQKAHQRSSSLGVVTGSSDRWESAIRAAVATPHVIHTKDFLPLPLSAHPITHVAPPPAIVELCEPVSQGAVLPETRIVVVPAKDQAKRALPQVTSPSLTIANGTVPEEDEDTSNEQFYSAAEDRSPAAKNTKPKHSSDSDMDMQDSNDEETDLSEGEGDTLGLSLPLLPAQPTGTFSALTAATPRVGNPFLEGIASPGSAVSGYSMSTVVGGGSKGRLFETEGLLNPVPGDSLHPKPLQEEDEEARAYVDTALLSKVGCFSGDWVRVEAAPDEGFNPLGNWGVKSPVGPEVESSEWRTLKLYAFPGLSAKRPRYAINKPANRKSGAFFFPTKAVPKVYLSPIILANLGGPKNVRLSKLDLAPNRRASRQPLAGLTSQYPPVAKDVSLQKLATPVAYEKSLDAGLRWALERHFKRRARIVKKGDLVAVPIDESLTKALHSNVSGEDDGLQQELLSSSHDLSGSNDAKRSVAWFRVGGVHAEKDDIESPWGQLAVVRPEVTKLAQAGDHLSRVPDATHSTWQYYLGTKRLPATHDQGLFDEQQLQRPRVQVSKLQYRLRELIGVATSPQAIHALPPIAVLLVSTQRHVGKTTVVKNTCADLGLHYFSVDAYDVLSEGGGGGGDVQTAGVLESRFERGLLSGSEHTVLLLQHIDTLTADRMVATVRSVINKSRIFIATTSNVDKIPEGMRSLFTHEEEISAPDEQERGGILRTLLQDRGLSIAPDVDLSSVAMKTAALVAGDLSDVVDRAAIARQERLERLAVANDNRVLASLEDSSASYDLHTSCTIRDINIALGPPALDITTSDFTTAVDAARKNFADSVGAPKIPNVSWDDVGGLANVKDAVMETIQLPLERPELFAKGMKKRSGILFYGPPGTGKTLLAKAIATEFSLNFFSIKGPELLNMYIGESEANVRRVFQRARDARPCVVFFDELDSVAPKRGNQGDSGGVMDRIVSQLLAELDGMSSGSASGSSDVFVIGATNRPDLLDQALLRPGRFDKMLYLGVSDTHEKQLTILEALTRKFALDPSLELRGVAENLPLTYTGADLYALCSDAMLKAITRKAEAVDRKVKEINRRRAASRSHARSKSASMSRSTSNTSSSQSFLGADEENAEEEKRRGRKSGPITTPYFFDHLATADDVSVSVEIKDFEAAHKELVSSVSAKELQHYERVRAVFERIDEAETKAKTSGPGVNGVSQSSRDEDFVLKTGQMSLGDDNGWGIDGE